MDKEYFLDAGVPPTLHFDPSPMSTWQSLSLAPELNCSPEQLSNCFLNPSWSKSTDQLAHFESALSSMVSSPAASNSAMSNDTLAIRELIGKLGNICSSGEILPATASYINGGNKSSNTSCYSTPLNSPPKTHLPIMNHMVNESLTSLRNSIPLNPILPSLSADPGFAERAAKFSSFGSRSFNGRTGQLPYRSSQLMGVTKLPRISSSPSLKPAGSPMGVQENKNSTQTQMEMRPCNGSVSANDRTEFANSNEESSVSEQIPKTPNDFNSRKRKVGSRGKTKEIAQSQSANATKVAEGEGDSNSKRYKTTKNENGGVKTEEETKGSSDEDQKQTKSSQKPPEPPKDYIHVRARRGQATDSHSLAERVRREKISERMKLLQDLVPNCNKVTGKALMLDEIINYVQSLQRQVEFLSMKLASVKPNLDFNIDTLLSKEGLQLNCSLPQQVYQLGSSASAFYGHQPQQSSQVHTNVSNVPLTHCLVDPLDTTLRRTVGMQLPPADEFGQGLPQFSAFCEEDLQSIVQMGFNPNPSSDFHSQSFPSE